MLATSATPPSVVDVTESNFEAEVLIASTRIPVLLDFWAPWCAPCKQLTPILEKLAAEFSGRLILAKVNIDEQQQLAAIFQIRSVPTVLLLSGGRPVDGFVGAQPESAIRDLLARHIPEAVDDDPETEAPAPAIDNQLLIADLRGKIAAEPDKGEHRLALAEALSKEDLCAEAGQLLDALPPDLALSDGARRVRARMSFLDAVRDAADLPTLDARIAADASDLASLHLRGASLLLGGAAEPALEDFLAIMQKSRKFGEDLGRRSLIDAFALIEDADLVARTRRRMAALIF